MCAKTKKMKQVAGSQKLCRQPKPVARTYDQSINPGRLSYIITNQLKWVNGTELRFMFTAGATAQQNVVRNAFKTWKNLGIGLTFKEVQTATESIIRIGFDQGDGSWSYVGRDNLEIPKDENTMNFGWDLTTTYGMTTALHEVGHAIGFQHEHQSPNAGIVWNEAAVYSQFSGPPNNWDRASIRQNILNKLNPNNTTGSNWDPKSIMQYEFGPGLILQPAGYQNGVFPPGMLSAADKAGIRALYPPLTRASIASLAPQKSVVLKAAIGEQDTFEFKAPATKKYTFQTTGEMDTVMVVFEKDKNEKHYMAGDDDSGTKNNSKITLPLVKGRTYEVNVRIMYAAEKNNGTIIVS